jgi:hypothetical protein
MIRLRSADRFRGTTEQHDGAGRGLTRHTPDVGIKLEKIIATENP